MRRQEAEVDGPRLERGRAQLRDVEASLAELDRRRKVSMAAAEAARGRVDNHSRVDEQVAEQVVPHPCR